MLNINEETLLVGSTELRSSMPRISKEMKTKKIIIIKRGKPFAILTDFEEYERKEELLETFEDLVLGHLAKERDEKSSEKDFVSAEEVEKKFGL